MGKYHDYYDSLNIGKKDYKAEVERLQSICSLNGISQIDNILEIGSGTGNHTEYLCEIANKVVACDTDQEMIDIAIKKLSATNVSFFDDLSKIEDNNFNLCVMMWHVLNYFQDISTINHIFSNVHNRLLPNSLFIFDAWNGIAVIRDIPKTVKNEIETDDVKIVHELNSSTSLMDQRTIVLNKIAVYKNGKLTDNFSKEVYHYIWTPKIISELLKENGFELIKIAKVNDYSTLANEDDWKIVFIARKDG